jgi:hypothetical protein
MPQVVLLHGTAQYLPLHDKRLHCVVTSPPYFGLRNYGGAEPTLWPGGEYTPVPGNGYAVPIWKAGPRSSRRMG